MYFNLGHFQTKSIIAVAYFCKILTDCWCKIFQAKVGSYLGFGCEFIINRQIANAVITWAVTPDPEIQVCTKFYGRRFHFLTFCNIVIYNFRKFQKFCTHALTMWTLVPFIIFYNLTFLSYVYLTYMLLSTLTLMYRGHTGWTSSKLITRVISLGSSLIGAPTSVI